MIDMARTETACISRCFPAKGTRGVANHKNFLCSKLGYRSPPGRKEKNDEGQENVTIDELAGRGEPEQPKKRKEK
jgi:hypothetical protein